MNSMVEKQVCVSDNMCESYRFIKLYFNDMVVAEIYEGNIYMHILVWDIVPSTNKMNY